MTPCTTVDNIMGIIAVSRLLTAPFTVLATDMSASTMFVATNISRTTIISKHQSHNNFDHYDYIAHVVVPSEGVVPAETLLNRFTLPQH
jgi:hypothetical protein